MDSFLGLVGIGALVFLCYAGSALNRWAKHRWPTECK